MLSTDFQFFTPTELSEALSLLGEHADDGGKVVAGGMSMVPAINLGLLRPSAVISLNHISGLDYVEDAGEVLRIGSMVRHDRIAADPLIRKHMPLLSEAAGLIADVQVRHRGTIGGSIAHADPSADYLPVAVALGARIKLASVDAERTVEARAFFLDVMMTALEPTEIVVEIEVPKLPTAAGSAYVRLARVEGSFAIVNAAAIVSTESVVAIGGAVPTPVLVELGGNVAEGSLDAVGDAAYEACGDAYGDLGGTADYRRSMARVYARRAVEQALLARRQ